MKPENSLVLQSTSPLNIPLIVGHSSSSSCRYSRTSPCKSFRRGTLRATPVHRLSSSPQGQFNVFNDLFLMMSAFKSFPSSLVWDMPKEIVAPFAPPPMLTDLPVVFHEGGRVPM